jgi:hypothetical protein
VFGQAGLGVRGCAVQHAGTDGRQGEVMGSLPVLLFLGAIAVSERIR